VGVSNKSAAMQCEDVAGFNLTLSMLFCFSVPSISLFTFQRSSAVNKENVLSQLDKTCFSCFKGSFVLGGPSLVFVDWIYI